MRPILLEWRGIRLYPYTLMLYLGIVAGVVGGTLAAQAWGLDAARVHVALLLLVLPALFGARLLFVALHWEQYRANPGQIFRRAEGGASLYGALGLMLLVSLPLLPALGLSLGGFWDAAAITLLICMVITRIGCLLNGCCAGRPSEEWWAVRSRNERGVWCRRIPTQLLESGLALLLLVGLLAFHKHLPFAGAAFLIAVGCYGAARWWFESLRESADPRGVTVNRAISLSLVGLSLGSFLLCWIRL